MRWKILQKQWGPWQIEHFFKSNYWQNYQSRGRISWTINESWLTINEKYTHTINQKCFVQVWVTAVVSATDAAIQKKNYGSAMTALMISNGEKKDIME